MKSVLTRLSCLCFLGGMPVFANRILLNEIMYHPAPDTPEDNGLEWLELYNKDTNAVNLKGWRFSKGISFTFSNDTVIAPGGYLVVAANVAKFHSRYPGVANVVGDWNGVLSNNGDQIDLDRADGEQEESVEYASEGDWAIRQRGPDDLGHQGWIWFTEADGMGRSLELVNPAMPNQYGQNWAASLVPDGTPGAANSVLRANIPPLILDVIHSPAVPRSTDTVAVTARILDESTNGLTVSLFFRVDVNPQINAFTRVPMFDDGAHGDGAPGDAVYGAILPARPDGTIVECYVQATDSFSNARTWPGPTLPTGTQTANLLYQVDDSDYSGDQPIYRLIMTQAEAAELASIPCSGAQETDAAMNGTFISRDGVRTEVRYTCNFRNRGHGSRCPGDRVPNYRVNLPNDRRWNGVPHLILNSQYTHAQVVGSALFQKAGLPMANSRPVQVRVNHFNLANAGLRQYGSYAHNEELGSEFLAQHFPLDTAGNVYRAIRVDPNLAYANFNYYGPDKSSCLVPPACYANLYFKQNNVSEDDWSDIIGICYALSTNTLDVQYSSEVHRVLEITNWMLYFACNTLVDNRETALSNGEGDDYAMYRSGADGRFRLMGYDTDTIVGQGDSPGSITASLFRMTNTPPSGVDRTNTAIIRLMTWPEFTPIYYATLKHLIETTFSAEQFNPLLDRLLGGWVPNGVIDAMKTWQAQRNAFVLSRIPTNLVVTAPTNLVNGYLQASGPTISMAGLANIIDTRAVRVNGSLADWNHLRGVWSISGVALQPGINRVLIQSFNAAGEELERLNADLWYDDGSLASVSGTLSTDTVWTAAAGPYLVTATLTVPTGATLTVQPGTTIYLAAGTSLTVNGRLSAEGTELQHIRITRVPGGNNWGSLDFLNSSVESRLAYVDFEFAGGSTIGGHNAQLHVNNSIVYIDHCTWPPTPVVEYISFDASSFIVQSCFFPSYPPPTGPESLHGINGIPAGGHGIFRDNYFGRTWGFNDTIDFTGGQRPGAILQILNNVFDGAGDDNLDLDSTDAWIEGNIFMHVHRDPNRTDDPRDTSSAISGGIDFANQFSEWTILNNLFYDVDHACLNKGGGSPGGGRFVFVNNTLVHVAKENGAGLPGDLAAFDFTDDGVPLPDPAYGAGAYVAGNIIWDCPALVANYNPSNHTVIFENNLLPLAWNGPGSNNVVADPRLHLERITNVTNADWRTVRSAFALRSGSPALGTGIGGFDKGGLNPRGLLVFGEPSGTTTATGATLTVAPGGTFPWGTLVPPYQWGYEQYKWKLDNGPWSPETSITTAPTISLSNLSAGPHTVYVSGKNDAGYYQDDGFVYPAGGGLPAHVTASRTWVVTTTSFARVRLNELLAFNHQAVVHEDSYPDLVELYNEGGLPVDLSGMGLTDDPAVKFKFAFPPNTMLGPRQYLVLYADSEKTSGTHLGFGLKQNGDALYLFNANGGQVDSVQFGFQLADLSIGRLADGSWGLTVPTFGEANIPQPVGETSFLKINEWLTDGASQFTDDFIELYSPDPLPLNLGGLYLSDAPAGAPNRSRIPALSFMRGFGVFIADGEPEAGADHLDFKLSPLQGQIALYSADLSLIDCVVYGPQTTDISQGRQPSGTDNFAFFSTLTPGAPNPVLSVTVTVSNTVVNLFGVTDKLWRYDNSGADLGTAWRAPSYNDSSWQAGFGMFGFETTPGIYPYPFQTTIPAPNQAGGQVTVYYRTHFQWTNGAGFTLIASNYVDDGAVFYLNGAEVGRLRLTGTVFYNTTTQGSAGEPAMDVLTFPTATLVNGDNVLAVEVHQQSCCGTGASSDDVFGMSLMGLKSQTNVTILGVVLNEVMAKNLSVTNAGDTNVTDWVELYNPSADSVDLSDFSLSDNLSSPRRWVFPSGVTLAPGAYLVVRCNPGAPATSNAAPVLNTGFGLDADQGDALYLFATPARGGGLLDSVVFGLQAADYSIARVPNGLGGWGLALPTPGGQSVAAALGNRFALRVNEWMANPSSGEDFFELYNPNSQPVSLGGLFLTDDLNVRDRSRIRPLSFVGTGVDGFALFIADGQPTNGANHADFKLDKDGNESIGLFTANGALIDAINFAAQQRGISEGRFPDGATNLARFPGTPTPGESNLLPLDGVVVNEVLTHSELPFEDAIELRNITAGAIDLSNWYLTDSKKEPRKFRIPNGTILPAGGFVVFYENQFNPLAGGNPGFALSSVHGDDVFLFTGDAAGQLSGFRAGVKFGPAENGVSFGRYETSVGADFTTLRARTFGADIPVTVEQFRSGTGLPNADPLVGPIVINEIMYHPPDLISGGTTNDNDRDEFIELQNISATAVSLFHTNYPTNTWRLRDAVDFNFPLNVTMPAGGYLLVVGFDPATNAANLAAFRTRYGMSESVPIYGPWQGKLANDNENIELYKPGAPQPPEAPDAGFVPYVLAERVKYADSAPWPALADGRTNGVGLSLQRRVHSDYGNDPTNWLAGVPTPGSATGPGALTLPVITSLTADHAVAPGANDSLVVSASGAATLSYQWYFNAAAIPGAIAPTLFLNNFQSTNAGIYSVVVANDAGAASAGARVDLRSGPVITRQPQNQIVVAGGTTAFSVLAAGTLPLTYQWQHNATNLPGAVNPALVLTNIQLSYEGGYRVIVANTFGSITSTVATLTINSPPAITAQPESTNVIAGATVRFSVSVLGSAPLAYQWRFNNANIPNATNATLTLTNVQLANAGEYRVRIVNAVGSVLSDAAILDVSVPPTVTIVASDPVASEPSGDSGEFTLSRTGGTAASLQVNFSVSGTAQPGADYVALAGPVTIPAGTNFVVLTVTVVDDLQLEGDETVVVALAPGTEYVVGSPSAATVRILDDDNLAPLVTMTSPADGAVFNFPAGLALGATAFDPDGSIAKVEFYENGTNKLGQATVAPYGFNWTNAAPGMHAITAVATDNLGSTAASAPVSIVVNAPPTVALVSPSNGASLPEGSTINLVATATDSDGTVARVDFYQGASLLGTDTTSPYSFVWTNVAGGVYTLTARATDDRGAATVSLAVHITVKIPTIGFADSFVDRGIISGFTNSVPGNNSSYSREAGEPRHDNRNGNHSGWLTWTALASGPCTMNTFGSDFDTVLAVYTGSVVSNLVKIVSNDDASEDLTQSAVAFNAVVGTTYQIAVDGYSTNAFGNIVYQVNLPNPYPVIITQPQSQVLNQGANVTFTVRTAGPGPQTYQWRFNNATIAGATSTNLDRNNVQSNNQGVYTVVVSNSSGSVTSAPAVLTVRTPPVITLQPRDQSIPAGGTATFTVAAGGTAPFGYQWRFGDMDIPGATGTSLTLTNVQLTNEGNYSVLVTNVVGSAGSSNAFLEFDDGLVVRHQINLIPINAVWKYDQSGTDRLTAWSASVFADHDWASGPALLGFEDSVPYPYFEPIRTPLLSPVAGGPITVYFRTHFDFTNFFEGGVSLVSSNFVDDGAVYYLNGVEVGRLRMAAAATNFSSLAQSLNQEGQTNVLNLAADSLLAGDNVLAVEVHQSSATSSDVVFGMTLDARITTTNRPTLVNPQLLGDGRFRVTLTGIAGRTYSLDMATGLGSNWTTLVTFSNLTDQATYLDAQTTNSRPRFYRGRLAR